MSLLGGMPGTKGTEIKSTSQLEVTYLNGHNSLEFIPEGTADENDAISIFKPKLNEHIEAGSSGMKELKSNGVLRFK